MHIWEWSFKCLPDEVFLGRDKCEDHLAGFYCGELVIINLFVLIRLFGGKWMILVEDKDMYIWYFCLKKDEHWLSNWVSCKWTLECARALCNLFVVLYYQGTGILITIGGEEYKQMITRWTSLNLYVIKRILIFICCWLSPTVDKRKYIFTL